MNRYKVCVYAICKNEEAFADRWMDSMNEADTVVVTDTGSGDETVQRLRARGAVVFSEEINPWRFDTARNRSLDHVPEDTDICVCTDLDEVFDKGWREKLESAWKPDVKAGRYLFNWSLKADGTPDVQFTYFKVHARQGYRWVCPVHECLEYSGAQPEKTVYIKGMVLNHYPDAAKPRSSYLALLEQAVMEEPENDRMAYYLGREYMYRGMWEQCIRELTRHLLLKTATWREERCASMRWLAHACRKLSRTQEAYAWYYRAIAEAPHLREPYVECARMAHELSDWPKVFFMTNEALKISKKSPVYVNMGYAWDHTPDDLCALACYWLGMYDRSLTHAKAALAKKPDDERLINNLRIIEEKT